MGATLADERRQPRHCRAGHRRASLQACAGRAGNLGIVRLSGDWLYEIRLPGKSKGQRRDRHHLAGQGRLGTFRPAARYRRQQHQGPTGDQVPVRRATGSTFSPRSLTTDAGRPFHGPIKQQNHIRERHVIDSRICRRRGNRARGTSSVPMSHHRTRPSRDVLQRGIAPVALSGIVTSFNVPPTTVATGSSCLRWPLRVLSCSAPS